MILCDIEPCRNESGLDGRDLNSGLKLSQKVRKRLCEPASGMRCWPELSTRLAQSLQPRFPAETPRYQSRGRARVPRLYPPAHYFLFDRHNVPQPSGRAGRPYRQK